MSKHVTRVSFQKEEPESGSVRLNGSVSFDVTIDIDGPFERWANAVQAALGEAARGWLIDAMKQAKEGEASEATVKAEERREPAADNVSFAFGAPVVGLGDEATSQVEESEQRKRAAICQGNDIWDALPSAQPIERTEPTKPAEAAKPVEPVVSFEPEKSVEPVELFETSEPVELEPDEPVVYNDPTVEEERSAVMISPELSLSHGLDEDSDGAFFSDVPVTEKVSTEHSHASIRVKNATQAETRDYTPTERPTCLDKTTPANPVVEASEEWFSDDEIKGIVHETREPFADDDSDALIAALPMLNQKIGKAPTGRVPRPPSSSRPGKFSDRAPTGTALARLQKRLRAQRREE